MISSFYSFFQHNREDRLSEQGVTVSVNNPGKLLRYIKAPGKKKSSSF